MRPQLHDLASHVWGVSRAQDRVLARVTGLAPSKALSRLFLILQAFIDDSSDDDGGTFVLAGYIAPAGAWAAFAKDWEEMLPYGLRDDRGFYFKMNEMAAVDERMARVPAFYRIIEKHALMAVSCTYNAHDLA